MRAITDTTDLRQAVAEARGTGATGTKLYANLDSSLTRRITAEAYRQRLRVWAQAVLQSLQAGREPDLASPELDAVFAAMVRRNTLFEPTLFVEGDDPSHLAFSVAVARRAHQAGVALVAGTDTLAGVDDTLPNIHAELALLVGRAGLTPQEALRAATRDAAAAIGVLDTRGTVEAGKLADLVVLRANPLQDIRSTRQVELVIKHGKVHRRS